LSSWEYENHLAPKLWECKERRQQNPYKNERTGKNEEAKVDRFEIRILGSTKLLINYVAWVCLGTGTVR